MFLSAPAPTNVGKRDRPTWTTSGPLPEAIAVVSLSLTFPQGMASTLTLIPVCFVKFATRLVKALLSSIVQTVMLVAFDVDARDVLPAASPAVIATAASATTSAATRGTAHLVAIFIKPPPLGGVVSLLDFHCVRPSGLSTARATYWPPSAPNSRFSKGTSRSNGLAVGATRRTNDELGRQDDPARRPVWVVDHLEQGLRRDFTEPADRLPNGRQRRVGRGSGRDVVEAGQRHILRHPQTVLAQDSKRGARHAVVGGEDCIRLRGEQTPHPLRTTLFAPITFDDQLGSLRDPEITKRVEVTVEAVARIEHVLRPGDRRDALMSDTEQMADESTRARAVVDGDVADVIGCIAAIQNEALTPFAQSLDKGIVTDVCGDDQPVDRPRAPDLVGLATLRLRQREPEHQHRVGRIAGRRDSLEKPREERVGED